MGAVHRHCPVADRPGSVGCDLAAAFQSVDEAGRILNLQTDDLQRTIHPSRLKDVTGAAADAA
jgi:hypothetical protein